MLGKYIYGGFGVVIAGLAAYNMYLSTRIDRLKDDNAELEIDVAHLEADKTNLSLRLSQANERQQRETLTRDEIKSAIEELKDEPTTQTCGTSVHRALDLLRMRDNEVVEETGNS